MWMPCRNVSEITLSTVTRRTRRLCAVCAYGKLLSDQAGCAPRGWWPCVHVEGQQPNGASRAHGSEGAAEGGGGAGLVCLAARARSTVGPPNRSQCAKERCGRCCTPSRDVRFAGVCCCRPSGRWTNGACRRGRRSSRHPAADMNGDAREQLHRPTTPPRRRRESTTRASAQPRNCTASCLRALVLPPEKPAMRLWG